MTELPREPMPDNWKPASRFLLFIVAVVAIIGAICAMLDIALR